jgi:hypothetical protein
MTAMELVTRDRGLVSADLRPPEARVSPTHLVTALKRGAFVYISCATCGWDGPARRAYLNAERDAIQHQLAHPPART